MCDELSYAIRQLTHSWVNGTINAGTIWVKQIGNYTWLQLLILPLGLLLQSTRIRKLTECNENLYPSESCSRIENYANSIQELSLTQGYILFLSIVLDI